MAELSIRIKIGDREYPMRCRAEEEEALRTAGKMVNDKLKSYRDRFGIDDKQDLLAMVAFECLVEKLQAEQNLNNQEESLDRTIERILKKAHTLLP